LRIERTLFHSIFLFSTSSSFGRAAGLGPDCARPTRAFLGRALREQWNGPAACTPDLSFLSLARRDLTGGADLGARPPGAGSLHRAGCEDGRAGQRQDPFLHLSTHPFLGRCSILGQGWKALGALSERRWVTALAELQRLPQAVATNVRSNTFAKLSCCKFSAPSGGEA
jgi:hypothetical protein